MNGYRIRFTKHAYKRYRQRVGSLPLKILYQRSRTALQCGLYRHGEGVIKMCGIWWGCEIQNSVIVLITCLGRQDRDLIKQRRARHAD